MATSKTALRIESLKAHGFDESYIIRGGLIRTKCSRCAATVINGMAAHETGCTNARHECRGCNNLIPVNQVYCGDCT